MTSLNLYLSKKWSRTWSSIVTMNGIKSGYKVEEGWEFSWRNGIAFAGPFQKCTSISYSTEMIVHGKQAKDVMKHLSRNSSNYRNEGRGVSMRVFLSLVAFVLSFPATVVTLLTWPIYALLWAILFIVGKVFGYFAKRFLKKMMK